jgi:phosphate transport system ATP-binding protein
MSMHGLSRTEQQRAVSAHPAPLPASTGVTALGASAEPALDQRVVIECKIKKLYYGQFLAVRDTDISVANNQITAFIGPSGCGKSTVLRCLNRMNDFIDGFRLEGEVHFQGEDIYAEKIDPVAVRRSIGMVFQQPNPFAMSIASNVAFGLRLNRFKGDYEARIEQALRSAALWDEVKDKLNDSGLSLSGGQQQRLCIARAIAVEPELLLMDEPCSALDPIATRKIEELMLELKQKYTIAIVTHNLQQAQRVADQTAFLFVDTSAGGRTGYLIEHRPTSELFGNPREDRTKEYIRGEFS